MGTHFNSTNKYQDLLPAIYCGAEDHHVQLDRQTLLHCRYLQSCCCSVAQSRLTFCDSVDYRLPCPSPSPGACSTSCTIGWRYHPTMSASVVPFPYCLQSVPASRSFLMSSLFASGGQIIGASASVFPMNIQDRCPLEFLQNPIDFRVVQYTIQIITHHWKLEKNKGD